jgi:hypothetical protein
MMFTTYSLPADALSARAHDELLERGAGQNQRVARLEAADAVSAGEALGAVAGRGGGAVGPALQRGAHGVHQRLAAGHGHVALGVQLAQVGQQLQEAHHLIVHAAHDAQRVAVAVGSEDGLAVRSQAGGVVEAGEARHAVAHAAQLAAGVGGDSLRAERQRAQAVVVAVGDVHRGAALGVRAVRHVHGLVEPRGGAHGVSHARLGVAGQHGGDERVQVDDADAVVAGVRHHQAVSLRALARHVARRLRQREAHCGRTARKVRA